MNVGFSTSEVAKAVGVSKQTLLRWLWAQKIPEPKLVTFGGVKSRVWNSKDLERVRRYKEEHYYKHS